MTSQRRANSRLSTLLHCMLMSIFIGSSALCSGAIAEPSRNAPDGPILPVKSLKHATPAIKNGGGWTAKVIAADELSAGQIADINQLFSTVNALATSAPAGKKDKPADRAAPAQSKSAYRGHNINIDVRDIDILDFLNIFLDHVGISYVASPTVYGKITYQAKDKPWDQVLEDVLSLGELDMRTYSATKSDPSKKALVIARNCEFDLMRRHDEHWEATKRFDELGGTLTLDVFNHDAGSFVDTLSEFARIKIQGPATHKDSAFTIRRTTLASRDLLLLLTTLNSLEIREGDGKTAPIVATPASDRCFTDLKRPSKRKAPPMRQTSAGKSGFLDQYEANELDFKGFIYRPTGEKEKRYSVFVVTPDGNNARLTYKSEIGKNIGLVRAINDKGVEVEEFFLDSKRKWNRKIKIWPFFGHPQSAETSGAN